MKTKTIMLLQKNLLKNIQQADCFRHSQPVKISKQEQNEKKKKSMTNAEEERASRNQNRECVTKSEYERWWEDQYLLEKDKT